MTFSEMLAYDFVQRVFLVAGIAAIPLGIVGTFIVIRRIGYLASAIAHCALGGVGIGVLLHGTFAACVAENAAKNVSENVATILQPLFDPIFIALIVSLFSAFLIGVIHKYSGEREDTAIGVVWASGMAIGLLCLDFAPENVNITGYLIGDILLISKRDVWVISTLSAGVLVAMFFGIRRLEAVTFDAEFAEMRGISSTLYMQILLALTAITVVLMMRIVGMLLVVALLTIPAATAARFTKRLVPMMIAASIICLASLWIGLALSYTFNLASGPTIITTAAFFYAVASCVSRLRFFAR